MSFKTKKSSKRLKGIRSKESTVAGIHKELPLPLVCLQKLQGESSFTSFPGALDTPETAGPW